jgi:DegV family protein with EDD domain
MIRIIADTLSCITTDEAKEMGIGFLPQLIIFGDQTFRDDTEIDPPGFLRKLTSSNVLPKTAAPQPALYNPLFAEVEKEKSTAIVICPSAKVSGTVRSAESAAQEFPNADIRIIDTELIASPLGAVVRESLKWVKEGLNADLVIQNIKEMSSRSTIYFMVDTLEYLRKGGRIGLATALLGSLLDMKPILTFRHGQVEPFDKQRTKKRAIARMVEVALTECNGNPEPHLSIIHGGNIDEANTLADELKNLMGIKEVWVCYAPPAVLVHGGPGVLGVTFFKKKT